MTPATPSPSRSARMTAGFAMVSPPICYGIPPGTVAITVQARYRARTEDCRGTIEYCLRGFYNNQGESFNNADDCLWSRGKDPQTIEAYRILNQNEYDAGKKALRVANYLYNRFRTIRNLRYADVSGHDDKGNELIEQLYASNDDRLNSGRQLLDEAKDRFKKAFVQEFSGEIDQAIQDARGKLSAAWDDARDDNFKQLANLDGWIKGKTEEKYYTQ
ncbi:hypothetical protein MAJ_10857, partial [Metarhizium majus ARSEF 297]